MISVVKIALQILYPFDSLRSLRMTVVGRFNVAFGCGTWKVPLQG